MFTIELAGPCFADGERVQWPKDRPPDNFFAAHPSDLELQLFAPDDHRVIRLAEFYRTERKTRDGALVYEFLKRW